MTASEPEGGAEPGPARGRPARIPGATYRLQLRREFTFEAARAAIPYLRGLGVTDLYLSPISLARPGSVHGYDILDHGRINPELGGEEDLRRLLDATHAAGMGVILDVVPNHMCILGDDNAWWQEVLEDGPTAATAACFDIDWEPPKAELAAKVLLPFLTDQYGRVLESELAVDFAAGGFSVSWNGGRLPLAPESWHHLVEPAVAALRHDAGPEDPALLELESILRAVTHTLPALRQPAPEPPAGEAESEPRALERRHEKQAIRRRLAELAAGDGRVAGALAAAVAKINGVRGAPASFDALERLMNDQFYRLAHWRVAAHEINYRRFFDINDLAAVRVEQPEVFAAVHALPLSLAAHPAFTGVRVDHVDGLADPRGYLDDLATALARAREPAGGAAPARPYLVVEKILAAGETLRDDFAADGTTGYDFTALLARIFTRTEGLLRLREVAARFGAAAASFDAAAAEAKRLVLDTSLAAELTVLARRLDRLSEQHRYTRDFTLIQLQAALAAVLACFPSYRTYVREKGQGRGDGQGNDDDRDIAEADARAIGAAVAAARRASPLVNTSLFDFIESVLLHRDPSGLDGAQIAARRQFVTRLQQLSAAVFAKGVEDTAFYRYLPLIALNEVGGDPGRGEAAVEDVHDALAARQASRPHTMSATATHDSKRGEDARARLYVLSELADGWAAVAARWAAMNAPFKQSIDDVPAPAPAEEYLLYQTLVGAWPLRGIAAAPDFAERIAAYMNKARHEAKQHTSWVNPDPAYEQASQAFVEAVLDPHRNAAFLVDVDAFVSLVHEGGVCNSLAQVLLKIAAPGVPDFYQGSEDWDFSLVDPDNRRVVDFAARARSLAAVVSEAEAAGARGGLDAVVSGWFRDAARRDHAKRDGAPRPEDRARRDDAAIKTWVTFTGLRLRRSRRALFERGSFEPLACEGRAARHVVAFARRHGAETVLALCGRHLTTLGAAGPDRPDAGAADGPDGSRAAERPWVETELRLPAWWRRCRLTDVLTGQVFATGGPSSLLSLAQVFRHLPVALLQVEPHGDLPVEAEETS